MSHTKPTKIYGIAFVVIMALVFITLKLSHVIDWSWWWVISPIWISAGLVVLISACMGDCLAAGNQNNYDVAVFSQADP